MAGATEGGQVKIRAPPSPPREQAPRTRTARSTRPKAQPGALAFICKPLMVWGRGGRQTGRADAMAFGGGEEEGWC
jgi:hypothetical protein